MPSHPPEPFLPVDDTNVEHGFLAFRTYGHPQDAIGPNWVLLGITDPTVRKARDRDRWETQGIKKGSRVSERLFSGLRRAVRTAEKGIRGTGM